MKSIKPYSTPLFSLAALSLGLMGCNMDQSSTANSVTNTVAPATQANDIRNADNTGVNARDRDNATVTPMDQGNSPADRETTAKIRQAVVSSTNSFSMMAQNVKIITKDGEVTLRGPVATDSEKMNLVAIAKGVAGDNHVTDQIEVKSNNP